MRSPGIDGTESLAAMYYSNSNSCPPGKISTEHGTADREAGHRQEMSMRQTGVPTPQEPSAAACGVNTLVCRSETRLAARRTRYEGPWHWLRLCCAVGRTPSSAAAPGRPVFPITSEADQGSACRPGGPPHQKFAHYEPTRRRFNTATHPPDRKR